MLRRYLCWVPRGRHLRLFRLGVYASSNYLEPSCRGFFGVTKNLNLASKPFNNRALPWFLSIVLLCFSLIGLILVVRFTAEANRKAAIVEADINSLKQREQDLLKTALHVNDSLTPQQQQSLK